MAAVGIVLRTAATVLLASSCSARAEPFYFSSGNPDGKLAAASGPSSQAETADDFVVDSQTTIDSAIIYGLLPSALPLSGVTQVELEIYRVFPLDSASLPSGNVPTRTNSPSDVVFETRNSASHEINFTVTSFNPSFGALNSVLNGIHRVPNQTTGGDGFVIGDEVLITATLSAPFVLPAGHYFIVPQVMLSSGNFYSLSAPKPIVSPGTPFVGDLQSWIRNPSIAPDWLRIGTDIVGSGSFNQAFSLAGTNDIIFRDGFD